MNYKDSRDVTIIPTVISQATFSNSTVIPSTRTLSTISEQESKEDFYLPFDANKKNKKPYKNIEKLEITSLSSACQKSNHEYLHCSSKKVKPISALCESKEETYNEEDKINKENIYSAVPFIELGAVYKILNFITDSDSKISLLTNNCYNDILQALQYLLMRHNKKLDDLLLNNSSLHKCEHCGVISTLESYNINKKIKNCKERIRYDDEIISAKRECINHNQNNEKLDIQTSSANLINNTQLKTNDSKISSHTEFKFLTKERTFLINKYIENLNEADNAPNVNTIIQNEVYSNKEFDKELFLDLETKKENRRYECNTAAQNKIDKHESSNAMKIYNKEEIMKEISYESKTQIDDCLIKNKYFDVIPKMQTSQQLLNIDLNNKYNNIHPVADIMKYLTHGQFTELDKKENKLFTKLQERYHARSEDMRKEQSSVLYNSREDNSQRHAGFWLFDKSGHLPEIALNKYRYLSMSRLGNNNKETIDFSANISQRSDTAEKMDNWSNHMETDSLENCAALKKKENSTIFNSSSENFIRKFLDDKYELINVDEDDISCGRKLVSSKPSLDIARHVREQIAKDKNSNNVEKYINNMYRHDSNILVRLSPETRRKVYHLIEKIVSSDKDTKLFYKKYLNSELNNKKLLHSKSANAAFVYSKRDNQIIDIRADDYIPIKLSKEDKSYLFRKRSTQDSNKSKNSIEIRNKNTTSIDNFTKKIIRKIIYKDTLSENNVGNNTKYITAETLSVYRKILDNSREMDWERFQKFVEILHPNEKELWQDICKIIDKEVKRNSSDTNNKTEISIEISPVFEKTLKTKKATTYAEKIVFELDMTLKNIENFLDEKFIEEHLDL